MTESRLERLRRHRILMEIAVTERLSLGDARVELVRRHEAMRQRAREAARPIPTELPRTPSGAEEPARPEYWWEKY